MTPGRLPAVEERSLVVSVAQSSQGMGEFCADLRKWFGHKVGNWEKFRADYRHELQDAEQRQRMTKLVQDAAGKRLTLLYAAKDENHNHALVLAEEIDRAIKKGQ